MVVKDVLVTVISARRPQNVPAMEAHLEGLDHVWFVPEGQGGDYEYALDAIGAPVAIVEIESTQDTHQRNAALDWAERLGKWCVQIDDDLKRLRRTTPGFQSDRYDLTVSEAIESLVDGIWRAEAHYGGLAATDNAGFAQRTITTTSFVRSAFMAVRPGSGLRFDDQFRLKGDYDYTLQHLQKYGRVARLDTLLPTFDFGQGSGGCVDYRTDEVEQEAIERLRRKWPQNISRRTDKPNEVRLVWRVPKLQAQTGLEQWP